MNLSDDQKLSFTFKFTKTPVNTISCDLKTLHFSTVKKFMEEEYPQLLNLYIRYKLAQTKADINDENKDIILVAFLRSVLNIDNLISFLIENKELWQWVECYPNDNDSCGYGAPLCKNGKFFNNRCYIKHPAILYLEGIEHI